MVGFRTHHKVQSALVDTGAGMGGSQGKLPGGGGADCVSRS